MPELPPHLFDAFARAMERELSLIEPDYTWVVKRGPIPGSRAQCDLPRSAAREPGSNGSDGNEPARTLHRR